MYTISQVNNLIKTLFQIDATDFKLVSRKMFFVDTATGKATYNTALPNSNSRLSTLIGNVDNFSLSNDGVLSFYSTMLHGSGTNRKKYKRVISLSRVGTTVVMTSYLELFAVLISSNLSKNTASVAQARSLFNLPVANLEDVIQQMATATSSFIYDPYEFNQDNLSLVIQTSAGSAPNRTKISAVMLKNGVVTPPEKIRWEVWPGEAPKGLPNTTSNRNASAQFPVEAEFEITSDLRDRLAYPIMGTGQVRLVCMATTSESDGDKAQVMKEEIITLPSSPFNYFGL